MFVECDPKSLLHNGNWSRRRDCGGSLPIHPAVMQLKVHLCLVYANLLKELLLRRSSSQASTLITHGIIIVN